MNVKDLECLQIQLYSSLSAVKVKYRGRSHIQRRSCLRGLSAKVVAEHSRGSGDIDGSEKTLNETRNVEGNPK